MTKQEAKQMEDSMPKLKMIAPLLTGRWTIKPKIGYMWKDGCIIPIGQTYKSSSIQTIMPPY